MPTILKIKVNPETCSGCHLCEMACSLNHLGTVNIDRSAIRVRKDDLETGACEPSLCHQCKKMLCLKESQETWDEYRRRFVWEGSLKNACPFDALSHMNSDVYHCDLCGGDPQCVKYCSTGAIEIKLKK